MRARKPQLKPERPWFSSGPSAKRPGWDPGDLKGAFVGRSHRHPEGRARLREVIARSAQVLGLPPDYRLAVVPGSDTGAMETAMWNLLGHTAVDVCCWESFGYTWLTDVAEQLGLPEVTVHLADYGHLPDLRRVDFGHDVVFPWNGTTSGVRVPDAEWIPQVRDGLTLCDASSAVFGMDVDFTKLDAVTWSWQKALGGEGAHGMLALSPAAVERLAAYRPDRPVPELFRIAREGHLLDDVFDGFFINSPSMLAVEDVLTSLDWCERIGGLPEMLARSRRNLEAVAAWVVDHPYVRFLAADPATVSSTSICLTFTHPVLDGLPRQERSRFTTRLCERVEAEGAGYDIEGHREAPPGVRIWGGPTVDTDDIALLLPWIDWAFAETLGEYG
ncbi:phosphoserine transaminase [Actinacidiphila paucisporea]|uniref:phosphoserine transaminase n=1 Tax=Actinacidiphila paucisporea TaxID=310782 RepID=A0A1M7PNF6_9ACTN|nr:phosphoserine transaminase [Actinacidiphila paucisporea]SHN18884.1 phosphoserine aminotransferase apoenzyme [Actinacidiphila paucisporea]